MPPAPKTPGQPNEYSNNPLTADEAARIALKLQPSLGAPAGAIQTQQGRTQQTGSVQNPQFLVGLGYDKIGSLAGQPSTGLEAPNELEPLGISPVYQFSGGAAIRQLLFDFNQTRNLVRQSEALEKAAEQNLSQAQLQLLVDVRTGFFTYVNAIRLVKVNEGNVANRQRQLDLANARLSIGLGQPSDVATAQTSKSQGILELNQARDAAEQARIQLLQTMGVDPLTPIVPADESAPQPHDTDAKALTQTAVKLRPEVRSAAQSLAAARYGLDAAKVVDLPAIYAEIGAGLNGPEFPLKDNVYNIGIGFQVPIGDGGYRSGAVKAAKGQITTAEANLKTAVLQVRSDVAGAFMALRSSEQRVTIADNEVFNAEETVRVAEGRYSAGVGLFQDVTTAQALLLDAQTDQANARASLDSARTQLRRATGELLGDAGIKS